MRSVLICLLLLCSPPAAAQASEIQLETRTNGQDADTPPGPALIVGDPVSWTYQVSNTSGRDLLNVSVTDDQGMVVTCPATLVPAGESITCTASGTVLAGQYANVGTATAETPDGTPVSDSDPSHYFGQAAASVAIETATEGLDADLPPGPVLPVGAAVDWTYAVTNIGIEPLANVLVEDDQGVVVTCPGTTLAVGESMTCTAAGTVAPGPYANLGTVTAELPDLSTVVASDPSHHVGQLLLIEKSTNGQDADLPPGPLLVPGAPVSWTYAVTNPGPEAISNLAVNDDQGEVVTCPGTTLAAGESMTCTASGTAVAGQYVNIGTATASLPLGGLLSASDPSHYTTIPLGLETATNGVDADLPPGPVLAVGAAVTWTYQVSNFDSAPVTDVVVTDDQGVTVTCPLTVLNAGESMTCTANGVAQAGQYANIATVEAVSASLEPVAASDPSHYFGQDQVLDFGDAPASYPTAFADDGARHLLGSSVFLGACVDSELDGLISAAADGDDADPGIATFGTCASAGDDEDGVILPAGWEAGTSVDIDVVASEACTLSAFADYDRDGVFNLPDEALLPGGLALLAGSNPITLAVPAAVTPGASVVRFRCSTDGELGSVGLASDGEVEDYAIELLPLRADLVVTKTASAPQVLAGQSVGFTVTLSHVAGGATVADARLLDAEPAGASCSWTCSAGPGASCAAASGVGDIDQTVALDPGSALGFDLLCTLPIDAPAGLLENTASVSSGTAADPDAGNNTATASVAVVPVADLAVSKSDGVASVEAGGSTQYAITVAHVAGAASVTDAQLQDVLPADLACSWTCSAAGGASCGAVGGGGDVNETLSLVPGSSVTVLADCQIAPGAASPLVNTASVSSALVMDPEPANNSASDSNTVEAVADLAVSKTDGVGSVAAGGTLSYTITASHVGGATPVSDARLQDALPADLTCTWTCTAAGGASCAAAGGAGDIDEVLGLVPGSSVSFALDCTVDPAASGTLSNTASIAAALANDPQPGNNSATDTTAIALEADIVVSKSASAASAVPGEGVDFLVSVINAGPSDAAGVEVSDLLPAGLTCSTTCSASGGATCVAGPVAGDLTDSIDLPVGAQADYSLQCQIAPDASGALVNTATASFAGDPDGSDNSASASVMLQAQADIALAKTASAAAAVPGEGVDFLVSVSNAGPSDAAGVAVSDLLPAGLICSTTCSASGGATCAAGPVAGDVADTIDLPVGGQADYSLQCQIAPDASGVLVNAASASFAGDPDAANNSASASVVLGAQADLAVTVAFSDTAPPNGAVIQKTVTVTNLGPSNATGVEVIDLIPSGFVRESTTPSAGSYDPASGRWSVGALAAGDSQTLVHELRVAAPGEFSNVVSVSGDQPDPDAGNDSLSAGIVAPGTTPAVPVPRVIPALGVPGLLALLALALGIAAPRLRR